MENNKNEPLQEWGNGNAKNITFIVTQSCQLRCKYCYLVGKNDNNTMPFIIAKQTIDYLLSEPLLFPEKSIILDFIGGEPLIEVSLIDEICDYFKFKTFEIDHHWFNSYRISISTNGINYHEENVQKFIGKNKNHLSIGITLDGTAHKHDINRVYPNGSGSYNDVVKNIPLWLEQFPDSATKVTVAHADIPFICESVLHLWSLGIKNININVVFENVWEEGDDSLFEEQLFMLAKAIIKDNLFSDGRSCSFFSKHIGKPCKNNQNWCGAGKMIAVDNSGNFYPCVRFSPFSLTNKKPRIVGNCLEGIDWNKVRPFLALTKSSQSNHECENCQIATGCAWCQGANYDYADSYTIYQRATFICKMHKARVKANNYLWDNL